MKFFIFIFISLLVFPTLQGQIINTQIHFLTDTMPNSFYAIFPEGKNNVNWVIPKDIHYNYTTSRSIYFPSINRSLGILIGIDDHQSKYLIIDENMNNDFSDDNKIYFQDTIHSVKDGNYKKATINLSNSPNAKKTIEFDYTLIKPQNLNIDLGDTFENKFFLAIRNLEYGYSTILIGGEKIYTYLFNKIPLDFSEKTTSLLVTEDSIDFRKWPKNKGNYQLIKPLEIINIHGQYFKVSLTIDSNCFLKFEKVSNSSLFGIKKGFNVENFSFITMENKRYRISDFKNKYLLFDFWGTWCGPCRSIAPGLKNLFDKYSSKNLVLISVAYNDKINSVNNYIQEKKIVWQQVFDNKENATSLCNSFKIHDFPSFILIDGNGKIVFRDEGLTGFENLEKYLSKIL